MATIHKWTIRFSILTPILIVICIFLMGGGHGWYTPTMVLFPWATLNTTWQGHLSEPFFITGIFQFTVYGFIIDKTKGTTNRNDVITAIIISHVVLTILILCLRNPEWRLVKQFLNSLQQSVLRQQGVPNAASAQEIYSTAVPADGTQMNKRIYFIH